MEAGNETVTFRMQGRDEQGMKRVEKKEVHAHYQDSLKYIHKKMQDKGVQRMDRHPVDGMGINKMPKSGRGGKYTWEGPGGVIEHEMDAAAAAIDQGDPNYVDEEKEERIVKGEEQGVEGKVVGEVEVAKAGESHDGVTTFEVQPSLI